MSSRLTPKLSSTVFSTSSASPSLALFSSGAIAISTLVAWALTFVCQMHHLELRDPRRMLDLAHPPQTTRPPQPPLHKDVEYTTDNRAPILMKPEHKNPLVQDTDTILADWRPSWN